MQDLGEDVLKIDTYTVSKEGLKFYMQFSNKWFDNQELTRKAWSLVSNEEPLIPLPQSREFRISTGVYHEPLQQFWLKKLVELGEELLVAIELDSGSNKMDELLKYIFWGFHYLFFRNPITGSEELKKLLEKFTSVLNGTNFWKYNPLQLVSCCCWIDQLHFQFQSKTIKVPEIHEIFATDIWDQHDAQNIYTDFTASFSPVHFAHVEIVYNSLYEMLAADV